MWTSRWSDFPDFTAELSRLRNEMERVFGRDNRWAFPAAAYPQLNVWEDDESLYVEAELPGMELNDLEIFINGDDQLTVQGQRKQPHREKGTRHRQERSYGKFSRMVQLPSSVEAQRVAAEYQDGVLLITLPKKEEARPRRIDVKAAG